MSIATVLGVVTSTLVFVLGASEKVGVLDLLNGHTWLRNTETGTLSLANDASAQVEFNLDLQETAGSDVRVTQDGRVALLVNPKSKTYAAVKVSDLEVRKPRPVDDPSAIDIVLIDGDAFVIDRAQGVVVRHEGSQVGKVGGRVRVGGPLTRGVVDDSGNLWVGDTRTGVLKAVAPDGRGLRVTDTVKVAVRNLDFELSIVDGNPTALVLDTGVLVTVEDGTPSRLKLPLAPGEVPVVPRDVDGGVLALPVNDSGKVILVSDGEPVVVPLPGRKGTTLGEPAVMGQKVYVPDLKAGEVLVLDRQGNVEREPVKVPGVRGAMDVITSPGAVYFQAPDALEAVQVNAAGEVRRVEKGRPDIPTNEPLPPPEPPPPAPPPPAQGPVVEIPAAPPGAPVAPVAQAGNRRVELSWGPAPVNGSPVTGYVVTWTASDGSAGTQTVAGEQTTATIAGLKNGTTYTMSVAATSAAGQGPAAQANPVTPSSDIPDAPQGLSAQANNDGSITLRWSAADDGHGNPVPSYDVSAPGIATKNVTGTSAQITLADGLQLGNAYAFTVRSRLPSGVVSPPSDATNPVKSHAPPEAPAGFGATASAPNQITLQWQGCAAGSACSGGETITQYRLQVSPGSLVTLPGGATSHVLNGLDAGTGYSFTLVAVNQVGTSPGATTSATAGAAPVITGGSAAAVGDRQITWNVSVDWKGQPGDCTVYLNGSPWTGGCSGTGGNLAYSTTYTIEITARNNFGETPRANLGQHTTNPPPPRVSISWGAPRLNNQLWVSMTLANFPANAGIAVACWERGGDPTDGQFWTQTISTDGAGNGGHATLCYYGFLGGEVWVIANGVESNHLVR